MMTMPKFTKSFVTKRSTEFGTVHNLSDITEFPPCILHTVDNFNFPETTKVAPDLEHPLLVNNFKPIRVVFEGKTPSRGTDIFPPSKGRIVSTGVKARIDAFLKNNRGMAKLVESYSKLAARREHLTVVSYNLLYRTYMTGALQRVRVTDIAFKAIINNIAARPDDDHVVILDLSNMVFTQPNFTESYKKINKTTIKYPESSHYLFMMHLLGLIKKDANASYFNEIPKSVLDKTNIVLVNGDKCIVYNLGLLVDMAKASEAILVKIIQHISTLSFQEEENKEGQGSAKETLLSIPRGAKTNSPDKYKNPSKEEVQQLYQQRVTERDHHAEDYIDSTDNLSMAQKQRAKRMAQAYKKVVIGDQTIEELMTGYTGDNVLETNELDFLEDHVPDKSMLKSRAVTFDNEYMTKTFMKDLAYIGTGFSHKGVYLTDMNIAVEKDELNEIQVITMRFEDINQRQSTIKIPVPAPDKRGYCKLNGSYKKMKLQRLNKPICKVSATRVTLNSNFCKAIVERNTDVARSFWSFLSKLLNKHRDDVKRTYQNNSYEGLVLPYEYTELGHRFSSLGIKDLNLFFQYAERFNLVTEAQKSAVTALEELYGVLTGTYQNNGVFSDLDGATRVIDLETGFASYQGNLLGLVCQILGERKKPLNEWVDFKLFKTKLPVGFVLAYFLGLRNLLDYLGVPFDFREGGKGAKPFVQTEIRIHLKDGILVIPKTPIAKSLILAGLNRFDMKDYTVEELDSPDAFFQLLDENGITPHRLQQLENFRSLFVDPMTRDALEKMQEPTNPVDLLIRSAVLLSTADHKTPSDEGNFRYRSYEKINAAIYSELAHAMVDYQNGRAHKFSISPYAVMQRVVGDQLMSNVDILNPVHTLKTTTAMSHMGEGGRGSDTMMVTDRKYDPSSVGVISEATVDSLMVAVNAYTSMDPNIADTRGMPSMAAIEDVTSAQFLSVSSLLLPGILNDDGKRANFANGQLTHWPPSKGGQVGRLRTGFERVIAHRTGMPFAFPAEQDGVISSIDEKAEIVTITYTDGTTNAFEFGEIFTNNGGGGFHATHSILLNNIKVGSKFKRGDILAYNEDFFVPDPYTKQVDMVTGRFCHVAFVDRAGTIEDSSEVSLEMSKTLSFHPTQTPTVTITKDTTIHSFADKGTEVTPTSHLMVFDEAELPENIASNFDEETIALISNINRSTPKAKYSGVISRIDVYHKCPYDELASGIKTVFKQATKKRVAQAKAAKGAANSDEFTAPGAITQSDRVGNIELDEDTVIFVFYVKDTINMVEGNKIVISSSLKSVISGRFDTILCKESGRNVDVTMGALSMSNRIILSPVIQGGVQTVMTACENRMLDIWKQVA